MPAGEGELFNREGTVAPPLKVLEKKDPPSYQEEVAELPEHCNRGGRRRA